MTAIVNNYNKIRKYIVISQKIVTNYNSREKTHNIDILLAPSDQINPTISFNQIFGSNNQLNLLPYQTHFQQFSKSYFANLIEEKPLKPNKFNKIDKKLIKSILEFKKKRNKSNNYAIYQMDQLFHYPAIFNSFKETKQTIDLLFPQGKWISNTVKTINNNPPEQILIFNQNCIPDKYLKK